MKKVIFTNKKENTVNEYTIGQIGEKVFALVYNVKETNDAIRCCNTHKGGDVREHEDYTIELKEM